MKKIVGRIGSSWTTSSENCTFTVCDKIFDKKKKSFHFKVLELSLDVKLRKNLFLFIKKLFLYIEDINLCFFLSGFHVWIYKMQVKKAIKRKESLGLI